MKTYQEWNYNAIICGFCIASRSRRFNPPPAEKSAKATEQETYQASEPIWRLPVRPARSRSLRYSCSIVVCRPAGTHVTTVVNISTSASSSVVRRFMLSLAGNL